MEQIPHIVHYCWFGKSKKTPEAERYIQGWKRILPDYQFVEWNEENFQMTQYPYAEGAYSEKRYAFVSDVARVWALYTQGEFIWIQMWRYAVISQSAWKEKVWFWDLKPTII